MNTPQSQTHTNGTQQPNGGAAPQHSPPGLLDHHRAQLKASGIDDKEIEARGYFSAETKAALEDLGFSPQQRRVPALVIPVHGVDGEIRLYQIRPDSPRSSDEGKPVKYETPRNARMALDVPPSMRPQLANPRRPLFITEGVKKADSAVSHGLCCIALLGVWNWRGSHSQGAKTALPDWESIHLEGRETYIVFDSDVMQKPAVHAALSRLKAFLELKKARVRLIYLEPRTDGGKVGLDDYLTAGHTVRKLTAHATDTLRPGPTPERAFPYQETPQSLVWLKPTRDGSVAVPLCNFSARIVGDIIEDDGAERRRTFQVEARQGSRQATVRVPAERFATLAWSAEALGAQAIFAPGLTIKDHARAAIQLFSVEEQTINERRVYTHLGWREIGEHWFYLHAAGAIGAEGQCSDVEVQVQDKLKLYVLPDPLEGQALVYAIQTSLAILEVGPDTILFPLYAGLWRSVLGSVDFSLHLAGVTGAGKSEISALMLRHYGAELDARNLPASWSSTANALEGIAFTAKDALLVVDDFVPTGTRYDVQRLHSQADRLLRGQGNQSGRARMNADGKIQATKYPRGLILSTGEDVPTGQSLRSRMLTLEVEKEQLDFKQIDFFQKVEPANILASALASYVSWLAPNYDQVRESLKPEMAKLRSEISAEGTHKRTPGIIADLLLGLQYFLGFAKEVGAVSEQEHQTLCDRAKTALLASAITQATHQAENDPAKRFIDLLGAAIASGAAHIASLSGGYPLADPERWGWRMIRADWEGQGVKVGWLDEDGSLYLEADASLVVVSELSRKQGGEPTLPLKTLMKRLNEGGYLASNDASRGKLLVRRTIQKERRYILHVHSKILSADFVMPEEAQ